jgi:hypothetical protein
VGLAVVMAASGHAKDALDAPPTAPGTHRAPAPARHHRPAPVADRTTSLPTREDPAVAFTTNGGRLDGSVRFLAAGSAYHLYVTDQDAVLAVHTPKGAGPARVGVLRLRPLGAAAGRAVTSRDQRHTVVTRQVWPGVDWSWHGTSSDVTHDLILAKGVDAKVARFEVVDARSLRLDRPGNLLITTPRGVLLLPAPTAWQPTADGGRRMVHVEYVLLGGNRFGYWVGPHDPDRPVTIETVVG